MGTGGITAIVVEVEKQKTAYVIIDGNNMIPNLREKILILFIQLQVLMKVKYSQLTLTPLAL